MIDVKQGNGEGGGERDSSKGSATEIHERRSSSKRTKNQNKKSMNMSLNDRRVTDYKWKVM